jgi:hypothetical protein
MLESNVSDKMKTNGLAGQTNHLLIKLGTAQTKPQFNTDDVIEAHNAIVNRKGTVWFGKSGRSVSKSCVELLNSSIGQKNHHS